MRMLAGLSGFHGDRPRGCREPGAVSVLSSEEFRGIVRSQPWGDIRHWKDAWYQYAVREKART